jgi:lipopolysaccharide/colanic/teichoic acid biosynthesis glycosyltransferase
MGRILRAAGWSMSLFPPGVPWHKRLFDLLLATPLLLLCSPIFAAAALLIVLTDGQPVLFRQRRPGMGGRIFSMYKFRTMRSANGPDGKPLPDAQRITRLGKILRASSIDDLLNLVNVVRGEMSLVGPRPLLVQYLERYSPEQMRRHNVLPGITGWAQVNGRNAISWEEKFALDVWYVDHWSLWLDIKILALTAWKVFKRDGISAPGEATAQEFMGNKPQDL